MAALFHDVHKKTDETIKKHRVPGAEFDEVTYADDTICISTNTKANNKVLEHIEIEGIGYGMKLNKAKCELIATHKLEAVEFKDGTRVKKV